APHVTELAGALNGAGHEVHIFTRSQDNEILGVHYHVWGGFDIVHGHDWMTGLSGFTGKRVVFTMHSTEGGRNGDMGKGHPGIKDLERCSCGAADKLICVSGVLKDEAFSQLDLDATFGVGTSDLVEATFEEFGGQVMGSMEKPEKPSLLQRIASLTSEDLGAVVRGASGSREWTLQERLGFWLFEQKFTKPERQQLEKCIEEVRKVAPDLMDEDAVNVTEVERELNSHNPKTLAKLFKLLVTTAVAKHGAQIAEGGLGSMGIGECEKVICAGDLKYELDGTGLHKCTWNCPANEDQPMIPAQFQSVGMSLAEQVQELKLEPLRNETQEALEAVDESKQLSDGDFETSKAWDMVKKLDINFHKAISDDPLVLLKTDGPNQVGKPKASAVRYHGKCAPDNLIVGDRLIFTGRENADIPYEAVVKVNRLADGWLDFFPVKAGNVEVKYLGKQVIVPISQVKREAMGKVKVDPGLQEWLFSTQNHLEVE
ncbi:unnamed protein product, partial [Symbiodinium sp. KB8]